MNDELLDSAKQLIRTRPRLVLGGLAFVCAVSVLQLSYRSYAEALERTDTEGRELSIELARLRRQKPEWTALLDPAATAEALETSRALVPRSIDTEQFPGTLRERAQKFAVTAIDIAIGPAFSDSAFNKSPLRIVLRGRPLDICRAVQAMSDTGPLMEFTALDMSIAGGNLAEARVEALLLSRGTSEREEERDE